MIVLGLDPGTVRTGFALVRIAKNKFSLLNFGVLSVKASWPLEQRLLVIGRDLEKIYQRYSVMDTAIEQVFLGKNPGSAFKLGQVFGLCAYQAQSAGSSFFPYAARYIKKAVTGSGRADKKAVQTYIFNIFGIKQDREASFKAKTKDSSDALAVALCHIYQKQSLNLKSLSSPSQINVKAGDTL